jgi:DUF1680 family protein
MPLHLRVPSWVGSGASVKVNEKTVDATPSPGSYFTLARRWKNGDRVTMELPMHLRIEAMPDEPATQAILYGPLVLAGKLGAEGLTKEMIVGPLGPSIRKHAMDVPAFRASGADVSTWVQPIQGAALTFQTRGQAKEVTLVPLHRLFGERYSIYWSVV